MIWQILLKLNLEKSRAQIKPKATFGFDFLYIFLFIDGGNLAPHCVAVWPTSIHFAQESAGRCLLYRRHEFSGPGRTEQLKKSISSKPFRPSESETPGGR